MSDRSFLSTTNSGVGTLTLRTETLIRPKVLKHSLKVGCCGAQALHNSKEGSRGTQALHNDRIPGTLTTRILEGCLVVLRKAWKGESWNSSIARRADPGGSHYADPTCISRNSSIARKELVRGDSHTSHADPEFKKTKGTVETRGSQKIT